MFIETRTAITDEGQYELRIKESSGSYLLYCNGTPIRTGSYDLINNAYENFIPSMIHQKKTRKFAWAE